MLLIYPRNQSLLRCTRVGERVSASETMAAAAAGRVERLPEEEKVG